MTVAQFTGAALGGLTGLMLAGYSMASSLPMPAVSALAGCWRVAAESPPGPSCEVELGASPAAVGYALSLSEDCPADSPLARVAGWRPAPDGISFAGADGLSVLFFSRHAPDRYLARKDGRTYVLTPQRLVAPRP